MRRGQLPGHVPCKAHFTISLTYKTRVLDPFLSRAPLVLEFEDVQLLCTKEALDFMADSSHWGSGTHRPGWEKSVCQLAHLFKVKKMQMPVTESLSWRELKRS